MCRRPTCRPAEVRADRLPPVAGLHPAQPSAEPLRVPNPPCMPTFFFHCLLITWGENKKVESAIASAGLAFISPPKIYPEQNIVFMIEQMRLTFFTAAKPLGGTSPFDLGVFPRTLFIVPCAKISLEGSRGFRSVFKFDVPMSSSFCKSRDFWPFQ